MGNFIENCKQVVLVSVACDTIQDRDNLYRSLNIVWFCKTLQNHKALVMSTLDEYDDIYWEVTYNGSKNKYYVDTYVKQSNTTVTMAAN